MPFSPLILAGAGAAVVTLALLAVLPSRFVRARLQFSLWVFGAFLLLEGAITSAIGDIQLLAGVARLLFVLASLNVAIALVANPWRESRPSERFPAIVQDVALIGLFTIVSTFLMQEQLLTTSAVGAVVVGFALQDTLGNLFAGLAIQIEKPFRVGQWVAVGSREGQVQEITWRATKLRTKAGQLLVVPNGVLAKEPILNYSEPTIPTRLEFEVGASYATPPNEVKAALVEALENSPLALTTPPPFVLLAAFVDSAINYRVQFWLADYGADNAALDQVRTNIWYAFRRRNIEIPWPIRVQYNRTDPPLRSEREIMSAAERLGAIDLFSPLPVEARQALSRVAHEHLFTAGEAIVREGESGSSMYVVLSGRARVVVGASNQAVAVIEPGGVFGEMSMLTGDPRTATVQAIDDVRVLEIPSERFREIALERPGLVEHITTVVAPRRAELDNVRSAAAAAPTAASAPRSLVSRIQSFLRLP